MPGDMDLTASVWGYACLAIFALAYALVVLEERLHLRKSIPALVAASAVWILVAVAFTLQDQAHLAEEAFRHNLLDYAELMLFLLAAMTFVNTSGNATSSPPYARSSPGAGSASARSSGSRVGWRSSSRRSPTT